MYIMKHKNENLFGAWYVDCGHTISTNWRQFIKLQIENVKSMNSLLGENIIFTDRPNQNLKMTFLIGFVLRKINKHKSYPLNLLDLKVHMLALCCETYWSVLMEDKKWNSGFGWGWGCGCGKVWDAWYTTETITTSTLCSGAEVTWTKFGNVSKYFDLIIINIFWKCWRFMLCCCVVCTI